MTYGLIAWVWVDLVTTVNHPAYKEGVRAATVQ